VTLSAICAWIWLGLVPLAAQVERAAAPAELWALGKRVDAVAALERDVEQRAAAEPSAVEARAPALLQLALWERELSRFDAALRHLEGLGAQHDALRGELYYKSHRYEQALAKLDARDREQCLWIVDTLEALERFDEAEVALAEASRLRGEQEARVQCARGRQYARDGRYKEAVPCFEVAYAADALDAEALFGLGQALVRSGDEPRGLELLERHRKLLPLLDKRQFALEGLALEPSSAPNHAALADVERELGRLGVAEREYLEAERLAPLTQLAPIALRLARLYEEDCKDLDRALAVLRRSEQRCGDARLPVRAGDLLAKAGRRADAAAAYRRALALRPQDAQIRARLAAAESSASQPAGGVR
jgi:tetratricopeptide (TPR) repeat protein